MWSSAMHFAIGFFGYPFEGQYEQSITIENDGVSLWSLSIVSTDICRHPSSTIRWHRKKRTSHATIPYTDVSRIPSQLS